MRKLTLQLPPFIGKVWVNIKTAQCVKNFLKILFIFRERGRELEREGEKHQCVVASHMPPTGDLARNSGRCPD